LCIHDLIEAQVRLTPEDPAILLHDQTVSYKELDQQATTLANHLREAGVLPETVIGIYLDKSADMIIALLATLKAGGAYTPLDPSREIDHHRKQFLSAVITRKSLADRVPGDIPTFCVDGASTSRQEQLVDLDPRATAGNIAYVIFTSGSTGEPKGAGPIQDHYL
jgi:arthrofactin-type cyclic lipopeptide synthetase B